MHSQTLNLLMAGVRSTRDGGLMLRLPGEPIPHKSTTLNSVVYVAVPADEAWIWEHPSILDEVFKGYRESLRGESTEVSYQEYLATED